MQPRIKFSSQLFNENKKSSTSFCVNCISGINCLYKNLNLDKLGKKTNQFMHNFKIKKGDPIYHNGDDTHSIYNLKIGFVKIEYTLPGGQHQINQFAIPGDLIGLDGIADGKHHLDAFALSDGEICGISLSKLNNIIKTDPDTSIVIERSMSEAINQIQEHMFSLGTHSAEEKLAFFLINYRNRLTKLNMRIDTIKLPMSREELRSYLGVTIETLSRSFTYLEKNGYIKVRNREINFISDAKLEKFLATQDQAKQLCQQTYGGRKYISKSSFM